jgi:hypothetical protein
MTPVGLARARQLLNRQEISPQTIDRMVSYFARHEVDKQGSSWSTYGKGRQAWDGWGGDPGRRWAISPARRMEPSEHSSAQPIHPATADARVDQPCNRLEPGKQHRSNDQQLKRGETDAKNREFSS